MIIDYAILGTILILTIYNTAKLRNGIERDVKILKEKTDEHTKVIQNLKTEIEG